MKNSNGTCLIVGAGAGLGASLARAFAREGLTVCLTRRPRHREALDALVAEIEASGGKARAFSVDARREDDMISLIDEIEASVGPLEVAIFNVGANVFFPVTETTTRVYSKVWEMAALAGFVTGREAARVMTPRGRGAIMFTGATASLRGAAGFSAFSGAKHGLRALAQSMARELGPRGVHVAHIVIDGAIDGDFTRQNMPDYEARLARDEILRPDDIAANYVWLCKQPKSAWTHELDLRPWTEKW